MKAPARLLLGFSLTALWLLGTSPARAAVGLTISPAAITNDYTGQITLTITGLTGGQAVQVERLYDVNGNGVIDPGQDFVVETFKLTDGQLPLLGGVRNLNMPGDDDGAANGQIQTRLNYPGLSTAVGGATGKFIFNVADSQTGASLATQVFSVAQKTYPQGVQGRIIAAATGLPVTNTAVVLLDPSHDGSAVVAATDANGNYSFFSPVGSFLLFVAESSFVSDQNAGFVSIVTNQFATKNLSLINGNFAIAGHFTDSVSGKPGGVVFFNGESTNGLFSGVFSDTNGNFSLPVVASQWKLDIDGGALAQRGYMAPQNKLQVLITNSSVTNLNVVLTKANAVIFGTVKDSSNNAVAGISLTADDSGGQFEAVGATDASGAYTLGVVGGNWNLAPDSAAVLAKGFSGGDNTNVTLTDGAGAEVDFLLQGVTAHLRGQVKDDHGNALANIQLVVQPFPLQPSGAGSINPTTDGSGNFDVGVSAGVWNIALECVSAQQRGNVDVSGFNFNVVNGADQNGIQLAFPQVTAVISGTLTDAQGHPLAGITLNANQPINATNAYFPGCVSTDATGHYQIGVLGGNWSVAVDNNALEALGFADLPFKNVTIVGGTATANFVAQSTLAAPQFTGANYSAASGVSLTLIGDVGHTNMVQFSSNLVTWVTLTNTLLNSPTWHIVDPASTSAAHRFYRAVVTP